MEPSPEIKAMQAAYQALPFAVRWRDSHFSGTFRFATFNEAFEDMMARVAMIVRKTKTERCRESFFQQSYLETPEGRTQVRYFVLADNVSSY